MLDLVIRVVEVAILAAIAGAIGRALLGGALELRDHHRAGLARLARLRDRDLQLDPHARWIRALGGDR